MIPERMSCSVLCLGLLSFVMSVCGCMPPVSDPFGVDSTDDTGLTGDTGTTGDTVDTGDTGGDTGDTVDTGDTGDTDTTEDTATGPIDTGSDYDEEPWGNWKLTSGNIDGCTGFIHYQAFMYEGAEATLVFLNGRTEYTDKYHRMLDLLDVPWNIVMFDLFGQGRSNGLRAHCDDYDEDYVCDLNEVIIQLVPEGIPLLVGGHSLGAFIASRHAALYPGMALGYVLSSPMFGMNVGPDYTPEEAAALAKAAVEGGLARKASSEGGPREDCSENIVTHDLAFCEEFNQDPITLIGPPTFGWADAFYRAQTKAFESIADVVDPVMIFQAGEEMRVLNEKQDEFCDGMNALNAGACEKKVFEGKYHELLNETDRELVIQAMIDFFQGLLVQ